MEHTEQKAVPSIQAQRVFTPFAPTARRLYGNFTTSPEPIMLHPYEYSGWRDECESWKRGCYIHAALNPHATCIVEGPDALRFFREHSVNTFAGFVPGMAKHAVMCNKQGYIWCSGVLLRTGEERFETHGTLPPIVYPLHKGGYRATLTDISREVFNCQLGGPKSLEILEAASGDNLHDIRFCAFRDSAIAGIPVRILRVGMAGTLAYEVHGRQGDFLAVYTQIVKAGEEYGLRKLGLRAYTMTHWENGFPQASLDYPWAPLDDGYTAYLEEMGLVNYTVGGYVQYTGSMGADARLRWKTPVDLGWERLIRFDHEFIGRQALERLVAAPPRRMVTLEWDPEDLCDVYRSQFEPGEPYKYMDQPEDFSDNFLTHNAYVYNADRVVDASGREVGISSGRMISHTYRRMISLCSLDTPLAAEGVGVFVVWGEPGARQKRIRARVARYPYLNEPRNETVDVSRLPYGFGQGSGKSPTEG